jgi:hypothetical protein
MLLPGYYVFCSIPSFNLPNIARISRSTDMLAGIITRAIANSAPVITA